MRKGYFITSEETSDSFVGLRFREGVPEVVFPHGFNISDDEKESRKDVFRLLGVLQKFSTSKEGEQFNNNRDRAIVHFPIAAYQYIIQDFLAHGYYSEYEVKYVQGLKGKINWKHTVQKEQPQLDCGNVVYLNFQLKTNQINTDNIITAIHKYCVFKSFFMFGWLYLSSSYLPEKPTFKADQKLFVSVLKHAINNTFNDSKKKLFRSMIDIILDEDDSIDIRNASFGVSKFENIWERLIDRIYGDPDKDSYLPHAIWYVIKNGAIKPSSALVPDTIMKYKNKIYVLDAKYYQYGITAKISDLPQTSSIQKQITYGKHIAENSDEISISEVYNAFIMPFNARGKELAQFVSVGTADWEAYTNETPNYAFVLGLLLDTKRIITDYSQHNQHEIEMLADLIESSLKFYRKEMRI